MTNEISNFKNKRKFTSLVTISVSNSKPSEMLSSLKAGRSSCISGLVLMSTLPRCRVFGKTKRKFASYLKTAVGRRRRRGVTTENEKARVFRVGGGFRRKLGVFSSGAMRLVAARVWRSCLAAGRSQNTQRQNPPVRRLINIAANRSLLPTRGGGGARVEYLRRRRDESRGGGRGEGGGGGGVGGGRGGGQRQTRIRKKKKQINTIIIIIIVNICVLRISYARVAHVSEWNDATVNKTSYQFCYVGAVITSVLIRLLFFFLFYQRETTAARTNSNNE